MHLELFVCELIAAGPAPCDCADASHRCHTLTVPDYEIIARLDKLILANQANLTTAIPLDDIMDKLGDDFRAGYHNAGYVLADRVRRHRSPNRTPLNVRPKSPVRKNDAKVY